MYESCSRFQDCFRPDSTNAVCHTFISCNGSGPLAQKGRNSLHLVGTFIPLGNCPGPGPCLMLHLSCCTLLTLCIFLQHQSQPGQPCFQESTCKSNSCLSDRLNPEGSRLPPPITVYWHCYLNWCIYILRLCSRWQCQASRDISGNSPENIRKATNTLLGIISMTWIKSRVSSLGFGGTSKNLDKCYCKKLFVWVHSRKISAEN